MRTFVALTVLALLASGCTGTAVRQAGEPQPAAAPPTSVVGTWEFSVGGGKATHSSTFTLSDAPAETCLSGSWYQAQLISSDTQQVSRPAYRYEAGRLELLLSTELCDAYSSFIGSVTDISFTGAYVSYGLFGSTEHGKVTGTRRL